MRCARTVQHRSADEQAELDFQTLCRSFGDSDDEDIVRPPPKLPTATSFQRCPLTRLPVAPSSFALLDHYGDGHIPIYSPNSSSHEGTINAAEGDSLLFGGKAAEYARRDDACTREERSRQASQRYYQRNRERACKLAKINYQRKKIEMKNATDEERLAAYDRKKKSRDRYRQKNRDLLAQKARERRAKQRQ